ncbi:hypothetical protein SAMN06296020_101144 [Anoxynatronum buryatiense]|uniref:Uncharacterized protein n=1 Tax=Anoxynatronum buryatiense TaxID=489973 RepID=A0AA45WSU5_9CLOT|nr:hypothetical protein SAMN06296020_101144 [Anoxynatronum buryatiense]
MTEEVKEKFLRAFTSLLEYREKLVENCRLAQKTLCHVKDIEEELEELQQEKEMAAKLVRQAIEENAHRVVDPETWQESYKGYLDRYQQAVEGIDQLERQKKGRKDKNREMERFIKHIEKADETLTDFEEGLWVLIIERVTVLIDGRLMFHFKDGTEVQVHHLEETPFHSIQQKEQVTMQTG